MPVTQTFSNQTLGPYLILREAGRGGMSLVYEAEDTRIGRRVALKVLSVPLSLTPEQRAATIARLKREARAIARLSHPNIVAIFDIGEENGQHFLVMEFLEGQTLRERIAEGPLPLGEVAAILDGVVAGLDAVHAAGIVHRDIKPSNVMLLPDGGVKLMDFGVARQHEDTLVTQAGSIVGSPTYMAPEQTEGEDSSAATDLWSLGVTLYEMLAGRPPFVGDNIPRILYQVAHERPPALPQATPAVREVLNRALEKKPARRYRSARALADAFRAALPAPRVPTTPRQARPRKAPDRRPFAWAAGLLLLTLLAALSQALHPRRALPPPALSAAPPSVLTRPRHARAVGVARALTPKRAPVVRVASARQRRTFHHPKYAPRRVAEASVRGDAVPALLAHPRRPRRTARVLLARDTIASPLAHASVRLIRPRPIAPAPPLLAQPAGGEKTDTSPATSPTTAEPNLAGTWHGVLTHHRATLVIDRHQGNDFSGTMTVHTGGYDARVAVSGHVSPRTGRISMRETRRLPGTAANAWDLGTESGQVRGDGRLSGTGTDARRHFGTWSFSR